MAQTGSMVDQILDSAERRARTAGYDGFSFRDIAGDVGIKSASVHYHFPTKADLALALMKRYQDHALVWLGDASEFSGQEALSRMIELFRVAAKGNQMCLCGALGASSGTLPESVRHAARDFATALTDWLKSAPAPKPLPMTPRAIVALLEGALLLSVTAEDCQLFEDCIQPLLAR